MAIVCPISLFSFISTDLDVAKNVMCDKRKTRPDTRPIPVADRWAGAEMRVFTLFDLIVTDGPTDGGTDGRTDGWTDGQSLLKSRVARG